MPEQIEPAIDLSQIEAVTFDCYGTLIDWEAGIAESIDSDLRTPGAPTAQEWIARWEPIQFGMLAAPWRPYREILRLSLAETMRSFSLEAKSDPELGIARWRAFAETELALKTIAKTRRVGIISNIDTAQLARTLEQLDVTFAALVSAEEARAYKPSELPFQLAISTLQLPPEKILHVAFSWKYDLATARACSMRVCQIGGMETAAGASTADLGARSLAELALRLR